MRKRILEIDILRPCFVLFIICCHFSVCFNQFEIGGFNNYLLKWCNVDFGQLATVGFFVISGWALGCGGEGTLSFYKKRASKIFPIFYICYLLWFPYQAYMHGRILYNGSPVPFIWTLLGIDYYVGGSVSTYAIVGEWFTGAIIILYLLYPLLRILYREKPIMTTTVIVALYLMNAYRGTLIHFEGIESIFQDILPFWTGMMLSERRKKLDQADPRWFLIPMVILVIIPNRLFAPLNALIIILFGIFALETVSESVKGKITQNKVWMIFNRYSYPIYLLHHQIIYFVMKHYRGTDLSVIKGTIILVLCIGLSVAMAMLASGLLRVLNGLWKYMNKMEMVS